MKLHENPELFRQAILATAQQKNLPEIYIEKDYWVTLALLQIFHSVVGEEVVFKGGTALSKCYGLIERFSEDIDLAILQKGVISGNQLHKKLKQISQAVELIMPEIHIDEVTNKMGEIRKTAHRYTKVFDGDFGQIRDVIIVESSSLGNFEPYTTKEINSYVYEMMLSTGQEKLAQEYELLPFEVKVLDVKRTICEKIMSLVRFSYTELAIEDLSKKIRHCYDLYQLLQDEDIKAFFNSEDFEEMLIKIGNDDIISYKDSYDWLYHHPSKALIFEEAEKTWQQIRNVYTDKFSKMVFGEFPDESYILETLQKVNDRLLKIEWNLKPEEK